MYGRQTIHKIEHTQLYTNLYINVCSYGVLRRTVAWVREYIKHTYIGSHRTLVFFHCQHVTLTNTSQSNASNSLVSSLLRVLIKCIGYVIDLRWLHGATEARFARLQREMADGCARRPP